MGVSLEHGYDRMYSSQDAPCVRSRVSPKIEIEGENGLSESMNWKIGTRWKTIPDYIVRLKEPRMWSKSLVESTR